LLGATQGSSAAFIVEAAQARDHEPERINQGMFYFGAEIARSHYRLKQALANLDEAEALLKGHIDSLSRAARTEFIVAAAVR
jgi:hypothetical protein